MNDRHTCETPGCGNLARNKGRTPTGEQRFDRLCHVCHRKAEPSFKRIIDNSQCQMCGWSMAPCDRHRFNPKAGYKEGNVAILCPNCHRLVTMGVLVLEAA